MLKLASKKPTKQQKQLLNSKPQHNIKKTKIHTKKVTSLTTKTINTKPQQHKLRQFSSSSSSSSTRTTESQQSLSVPLDQQFPNITLPTHTKSPTILSTGPKVTQLTNGITVMTMPSQLPITNVQIDIDAGSAHELGFNVGEAGHTNFLAHLINVAAKSPDWEHTPILANDAASIQSTSSREVMSIHASTLGKVKPLLNALANIINDNDVIVTADLDEQKNVYIQHFANKPYNPEERFEDDIHWNVLYGTTLGSPPIGNEDEITDINGITLLKWKKRIFTSNRISIGAMGVDHDLFVKYCQELFGDITSNPEPLPNDPVGNVLTLIQMHHHNTLPQFEEIHNIQNIDDNNTSRSQQQPTQEQLDELERIPQRIALSWHGPEVTSPFIVPMTVLQTLIGESRSFSSGGPGKGMYARATTHLLGPRHWVSEIVCNFWNYRQTSIFNLVGVVEGQQSNRFIDEMLEELTTLSKNITDVEVTRAKNQLKRKLLLHFEPQDIQIAEMLRHQQHFGRYMADEYFKRIDSVTTAQVKQCANLLFERDSVVITSLGDPNRIDPKWFSNLDEDEHPADQFPQDEQQEQQYGQFQQQQQQPQSSTLDKIKNFFSSKKH